MADDPANERASLNPASVDLTRKGTGGCGEAQPKLPSEKDQAVGMTDGQPSEAMRQGSRDLKRGLEDTSRGTEAGKAYQEQKQ